MTLAVAPRQSDSGALCAAFGAVADAYPDAVAVRFDERELTYRELAIRSTRLAAHLRAQGLRPGDIAALYGELTEPLIVGLIAILKCGAAYAPLDMESPPQRLAHILDACRPRLLLCTEPPPPLCAAGRRVVDIADPAGWTDAEAPPAHLSSGASLAYVIFTSGSTGAPKGVMVAQSSVLALARNPTFCRIGPGVRVLRASSLAFDGSVFEIFGALLNGGALVVADAAARRSVAEVCRKLRTEVDVAFLTTALFNRVVDLDPLAIAHVDCLLFGGQTCSLDHVLRAAPLQKRPGALTNAYGPTEATVFAIFHPVPRQPDPQKPFPIGQPSGKIEACVVDEAGSPCPPGVTGEILLGGPGVAIGYLNDARLTAERFRPHPREPGQRVYHSGDFGYWNENHELIFVGRKDNLIKIRGYRVNLEEVAQALRQCPDVREAVVCSVRGADGDDELAAYVEFGASRGDAAGLAAQLRAYLPPSMIPARFIIGAFELNANGKIGLDSFVPIAPPRPQAPARPGSEALEALRAIWRDIVGREDIDDRDNFFDVGGHSLRAAALLARVADQFGVDLELRDVFDFPLLVDLAERIAQKTPENAASAPHADEDLPLTAAQAEIWPLASVSLGAFPAFHIPESWLFRGDLDIDALQSALRSLIERHDALRIGFVEQEGGVAQRIHPPDLVFDMPVVDLSELTSQAQMRELSRLRDAEAHAPFAFDTPPLMRARLLRLGTDQHLLLLTLHHLIADGSALGVLRRELARAYSDILAGRAPAHEAPPASLRDHVRREARKAARRDPATLDYFRRTFGGLERSELPTDLPRRPGRRGRAGRRSHVLPAALKDRLASLATEASTTLFVACAALVMILLRRQSGAPNPSIGFPYAGRDDPGAARLVGSLARLRPLTLPIDDMDTVLDVVTALQRAVLEAIRNSTPLSAAVAGLKLPPRDLGPALFDVVVSFHDATLTDLPDGAPRFFTEELTVERLPDIYAASPYDLAFAFIDESEGLRVNAEFDAALFSGERVDRMLRQIETLARSLCERPRDPVCRLPLLGPEEAGLIRSWCETPAPAVERSTMVEEIAAQAEAAPEAIAVCGAGGELSWRELIERARGIAFRLVHVHGVRRGEIVLLAMDWSIWCAPAILGVWLAGGAYLAFDQKRAARRFLDDAKSLNCRVALHLAADVPPEGFIGVDACAPPPPDAAVEVFEATGLNDLAYVVSTTGSSGRAKFVLAEHGNLACWVQDQASLLKIGPSDRVLQCMALLFDPSIFFLCLGLSRGARVVWCDRETAQDREALREVVSAQGVTIMGASSGQLVAFGSPPESVRALIGGGEPIAFEQVRRIAPGRVFVNQYGPSEAGCVTAHCVEGSHAEGDGPLPIGRPLAGVAVALLDKHFQPTPIGVPGELFVTGPGVARGYANRSAETAEAFRPHPDKPGARMYRTGDLARFRGDGALAFLGRVDRQQKVRGYRVDLDAIAAILESEPGIRRSVAVSEGESGKETILAFVETDGTPDRLTLNQALAARLPQYMLPGRYVALPRFPEAGNGKISLAALKSLAPPPTDEGPPPSPARGDAAAIRQAFARVLALDVTLDADFFEAGGDSLKALQLVALLRREQGYDVTLTDVFQHRTPHALTAALAGRARETKWPALERRPDAETYPATFAQMRLWVADQTSPAPGALASHMRIVLTGPLDVAALENSFNRLIARHEALRTRLVVIEGELRQSIAPVAEFTLRRAIATDESDAQSIARREAEAGIDLAACPPMRALLIKIEAELHHLVIAVHHAHCDGAAAAILLQELRASYKSSEDGVGGSIGATPRDYAYWERDLLEGAFGKRLAGFWRNRLKTAPAASGLPASRPDAEAAQHWRGAIASARLSEALSDDIRALALRHGATPFLVFLAALAALSRRYARGDDVLLGFPASVRQDNALEPAIGCFINPIPLLISAPLQQSVDDFLAHVREACVAALEHRHYPHERIIADMRLSGRQTSPFRLGCTWTDDAERLFRGGETDGLFWSAPEEILIFAKSDFWLHGGERGQHFALDIEYRTALYDQDEILAYLRSLEHILKQFTEAPQQPLHQIFDALDAPRSDTRSFFNWNRS
jgi:amino acid adenylation domain-containing protein